MKKFSLFILLFTLLTSCGQSDLTSGLSSETNTSEDSSIQDNDISVLAPSGTPALALANYIVDHQNDVTIGGADLLAPAFLSNSYDVIIAPLTVGVTTYNKGSTYKYYRSLVWGNFYIASKTISDISELSNGEILAFQKGNTPDVILQTILKSNGIDNVDITYASDVASAVASFVSGGSDTIIIAEPQLSNLKKQNIDFNVIDLQEEYQKVTGKSSYPQAAIFVKNELVDSGNLQFLDEMKNDINSCNLDTSLTAQNAINYIDTFSNMSEDVLKSAILGSNIRVEEDINVDKEAIDFYLTQLENLDLNTYGEKPQEDFYIC